VIKAAQAGRDFKALGYQTKMKAAKVDFGKWKQLSGPGKASFSNSFDPNTNVFVTKLGRYVFEWTATLKSCTDKDSITIDFFKLPILISKHNFSNDDETKFTDLTNRENTQTTLNLFTPNLIQTQGTTFIKMNESISFSELEYSWMNSSGNVILKGKIQSESCTSACEISSPVATGMFFLFIKFDDQTLIRKIIVME
jgi:hypothetical protein